MSRPLMITVFTDASLDSDTRAGGWGAWAKADGWEKSRFMGGAFPMRLQTSNAAELHGIAAALRELSNSDALDGAEIICLQCDSVVALGLILTGVPGARPAKTRGRGSVFISPVRAKRIKLDEHEALRRIAEAVGERELYLRHVKGHQGEEEGRSWVNEQCDAEARRHMRAKRAELALLGNTGAHP